MLVPGRWQLPRLLEPGPHQPDELHIQCRGDERRRHRPRRHHRHPESTLRRPQSNGHGTQWRGHGLLDASCFERDKFDLELSCDGKPRWTDVHLHRGCPGGRRLQGFRTDQRHALHVCRGREELGREWASGHLEPGHADGTALCTANSLDHRRKWAGDSVVDNAGI